MVSDLLNEKKYEKETVDKVLCLVYDYIANTKRRLRETRNYTPLNNTYGEDSQISFSNLNNESGYVDNPFLRVRKRTTLKQSNYEEPEDYDASEMEEGVPIKEKHFDFFQGLNDYYSPFAHLVKSKMNMPTSGQYGGRSTKDIKY